MPVYAVTGASGHLGRFVIEQLLARGVPPSEVVAVVRDRAKTRVVRMSGGFSFRGRITAPGASRAAAAFAGHPGEEHRGTRQCR